MLCVISTKIRSNTLRNIFATKNDIWWRTNVTLKGANTTRLTAIPKRMNDQAVKSHTNQYYVSWNLKLIVIQIRSI